MSKAAGISSETTLFVRDTCLCLHLQRAARALARRFDDALALRIGRALGIPRGRRAIGFSLVMGIALGLGVVPWLMLQTVGLP